MWLEARWVVELALGLTFLSSGLAKLAHPLLFARAVHDFRLVPGVVTTVFAWGVVTAEVFVGACHLTGVAALITILLALTLLTLFALALAISLARGRTVPCHCFGESGELISYRSLARVLMLAAGECIVFAERVSSGVQGGRSPLTVTAADVLSAAPWVCFVIVSAMWILRSDDVVTIVQRQSCRTCAS